MADVLQTIVTSISEVFSAVFGAEGALTGIIESFSNLSSNVVEGEEG